MAYGDYLFRRQNGIFYFRYVLNIHSNRREIRISLKTRKLLLAKQRSASLQTKLKFMAINMGSIEMDADKRLAEFKIKLLQSINADKPGHLETFESHFKQFEIKVQWVKDNAYDKFSGATINDIIEIYEQFAPVFKKVEHEANKQQRKVCEDEIRHRAMKAYGIFPESPCNAVPDSNIALTINFSKLIENYCQEINAGRNWREKTESENRATFNLFLELQGYLIVNKLDKSHINSFKEQLVKLPTNVNKHPQTKQLAVLDVVNKDHLLPVISISTVNKHLNKISAILGWAVINGYAETNIASGITIKQNKNMQNARSSFLNNELAQIFSLGIYTQNKHIHPYCFWLPLLGLYTGARIN